MFFNPQKYDFSRVGRLKLNTKLGLNTPLDEKILHPQDFYEVIKLPAEAAQEHRVDVDDIDHLGNRRVRSRRRAPREPVPHRAGPHGARDQGEDVGLPGNGDGHAARPDQREAGDGRDSRVLRVVAAVAVHGPDQPAVRGHAQAPSVGPRAGRSVARARRLRGARRAPDALRPHLPDRDAGRSEHRPDLARSAATRASTSSASSSRRTARSRTARWSTTCMVTNAGGHAKYKVGDIVEADELVGADGRAKKKGVEFEPYCLLPVGVGRRPVHHRAGQRRARRGPAT